MKESGAETINEANEGTVQDSWDVKNCVREDFEGFEWVYDQEINKQALICPGDRSKLQVQN
jgi:hypothetical protein